MAELTKTVLTPIELDKLGKLNSIPVSDNPPTGASVSADLDRDKAVNHPSHYKQNPEGIEVIQVTRHLNFNVGNAVKYLLRAGHKNDVLTDLEKARWYIDNEIDRVKEFGE